VKPTSSIRHTSKEAQHTHDAGGLPPTTCPSCLKRADIVYSFTLQSTEGPAIHVRVRCEDGHIYDVPVDDFPA
jgi:hypothetical protein